MVLIENPMPTAASDVLNDHNVTNGTPIQQFFAHRAVFITGGTGFFGKVLVEKLLRSCPDIEALYLLVRTKKGKEMHTRVDEIFDDAIFDRLKEEVPKFRHKIFGISGDVGVDELGISAPDRAKLQECVSVVFHGAATLRFDEKLKLAIAINVKGSREIITLCRGMPRLKALVHVSTAYANCNNKLIEEKFYTPSITAENLIKLGDCLDENVLNSITPQILGDWPNTYAFTKCITEDLVLKAGNSIPMALFRPAIVIGTSKEPIPGWIDNVYGPTGVVVGVGAGVVRTIHVDSDINANLVPVDLAVNALISLAWDAGTNTYDAPPIYNYVSACQNPISWGRYISINYSLSHSYPSVKSIWHNTITPTKYQTMYKVYMFLLHMLPAYIIDTVLVIFGKEPKLKPIYKKIHKFLNVIAYFSTQEWKFTDTNVQNLWRKLSPRDKELYDFDITKLDWTQYFKDSLSGVRKHLFKEDDKTLQAAINRSHRLKIVHKTILYIMYGLLLWGLYAILVRIFT